MFDMKKQLMWAKLKVGLVITLALLTLFITVFFAGGIQYIFSPKVQIKAQIKDVRGLRRGSPVWISGIEIGYVKSIGLNPEYGTLVTMSINKDALNFVKKDSKASVMTMGLLGDKYIELGTGSSHAEPIKPGDMIKGTTQLEIQDIVNASSVSLEKITNFVDKLGNFIEKFEKGKGTIAKFLTDPSLYNNLKETTTTLTMILKDFKESKGTMKMFIEDPSLYNNLKETTTTLTMMLKDFKESKGTMKMFIEDPSLYNNLLNTTSSMEEFSRKLNEGSGTLKRLAEDPEIYENLDKASKQLSLILKRIDAGEGLAGSLVSDNDLAIETKDTLVELKSSVTEFKELIKDVREHPDKYFKFSIF
jgi:phospholipid/cholesterol/gamma-HCH transport system substrate-binding protein